MHRMAKVKVLAVAVSFLLLFSGCKEQTCESTVPTVDYVNFVYALDSQTATLTISFYDCDGDLVLNPATTDSANYYNLELIPYYRNNGAWEQIELEVPSRYLFPETLVSTGRNKTLEGEIDIDLSAEYNSLAFYDTLKYEFYIRDDAGNVSNLAETTPLVY